MSETLKITPKIVEASTAVFDELEQKGIVTRVFHAHKPVPLEPASYNITKVCQSESKGHQLIAVNYNLTQPEIGYHPHPEVFMVLAEDPAAFKPLYLLTATHNREEIDKKIGEKTLSNDDFLIVKLAYNDPRLSCFIMNGDIPHCELTEETGPGLPPQFYVSEPLDMDTTLVLMENYKITWNPRKGREG